MEEKKSLDEIIAKESKLSEIADFWLNVLDGLHGIPMHEFSQDYPDDCPSDYGAINDLSGFSVQYSLKPGSFVTLQISYQKQEVLTFSFYSDHQQYLTTYRQFKVAKYERGVWGDKLNKMLPKREKMIKERIDRQKQQECDAERRRMEETKEKELEGTVSALGPYLK